MIVTHVTPGTFGSEGIFGGGERYPVELAKAMSSLVETRLVSFSRVERRYRQGGLDIHLHKPSTYVLGGELNPLGMSYLRDIAFRGDVLHAHQYETVPTNLALLAGVLRRRPVFVTDHGGRSRHLGNKLHLERVLTSFLPVSRFSLELFPRLASRSRVIYGGVDPTRYFPIPGERSRKVVFVGRILPHKGIDVLIEALPPDLPLEIYGHCYDARYLADLRRLAEGKQVSFIDNAPDSEVIAAYRAARVAVLPSLLVTRYGQPAPRSELLGLTLLEAMACGTPVICTRVGGMPEIVRDGETGIVVAPGDRDALSAALARLAAGGAEWDAMSGAAAEWVASRFTWRHIAESCLREYASFAHRRPAGAVA